MAPNVIAEASTKIERSHAENFFNENPHLGDQIRQQASALSNHAYGKNVVATDSEILMRE